MPGGRAKLPVLAEIGGPAPGEGRAWSLRRADLAALGKLQATLDGQGAVLVSGEEGPTAALALAAAASAAGRRTVLVECDLAQPRLAAELDLMPVPGLHEYLRWETAAPQILQPLLLAGPAAGTAVDPLVCVVAGRPAPEPATLLELDSFRHAVGKLRSAYELLVLIGPLPGSDGLEPVAAQADTLLAAVSPGAVSGRPHRTLRAALRQLPVAVAGAIVVVAPDPAQRS